MYTIKSAQAKFVQLVSRAERGEEIVINRNGKSVARLVGIAHVSGRRRPGRLKGQISVPASFFEPVSAETFLGE